jgi:hypothetical protein
MHQRLGEVEQEQALADLVHRRPVECGAARRNADITHVRLERTI